MNIQNLLTVVSLAFLVITSVYAGASYFEKVNRSISMKSPVFENMTVVDYKTNHNSVDVHVVGDKIRNCGAPLSVFGGYKDKVITLTFLDDIDENGEIHAPDPQPVKSGVDFGYWRLHPIPKGPWWMQTHHKCDDHDVFTRAYFKEIKSD